jgi:hypothetical protein
METVRIVIVCILLCIINGTHMAVNTAIYE